MEVTLKQQTRSDPLLKAEQVAERLRISRALAYRLMQTGEIPTVRFSRTVRVSEADLEAFILGHKSG